MPAQYREMHQQSQLDHSACQNKCSALGLHKFLPKAHDPRKGLLVVVGRFDLLPLISFLGLLWVFKTSLCYRNSSVRPLGEVPSVDQKQMPLVSVWRALETVPNSSRAHSKWGSKS